MTYAELATGPQIAARLGVAAALAPRQARCPRETWKRSFLRMSAHRSAIFEFLSTLLRVSPRTSQRPAAISNYVRSQTCDDKLTSLYNTTSLYFRTFSATTQKFRFVVLIYNDNKVLYETLHFYILWKTMISNVDVISRKCNCVVIVNFSTGSRGEMRVMKVPRSLF